MADNRRGPITGARRDPRLTPSTVLECHHCGRRYESRGAAAWLSGAPDQCPRCGTPPRRGAAWGNPGESVTRERLQAVLNAQR